MSSGHAARGVPDWKNGAIVVGVPAAVDLWVIRFLSQDRWLDRADEVSYWSSSHGLAQTLASHPWSAFVDLSASVAHNTLNLLPAFPIAVALLALGDSRAAYLLAVVDVYGLAVLLAFLFASTRRRAAAW